MEHNKRKSEEKKSSDDIKGELLSSLIDIVKKDETGLHDAVRNAENPKETGAMIKEFG